MFIPRKKAEKTEKAEEKKPKARKPRQKKEKIAPEKPPKEKSTEKAVQPEINIGLVGHVTTEKQL